MKRHWAATAAALVPVLALAQQAAVQPPPAPPPPPTQTTLPEVNIVGAAPLLGSGIDADQVPAATNVVGGNEVTRLGIPDYLGALQRDVPGVTLNQTSGNPYQPDLIYRGFTASPQVGANEGIAVFVNGARFNSAFGDIVNWDLIPDEAIRDMNLEGSNPVYGLNALGGSLNVKLKNGFDFHGGELTLYGGSFGKVGTNVEYGARSGNTAAYVDGDIVHDGGWRQGSATDLHRLYADLGWRSESGEAHLWVLGAENDLNNPGTTPVQLLDYDRALAFTGPNQVHNKYLSVNANVSKDVSDTLTLQGVAYYSNFSQRVVNGNTPNFQPCNGGLGLCEQDGVTPLTDRTGTQIGDFLNGGPYSQLNLNAIDTNSYGVSLQGNDDGDVLGHTNNLVVGLSFDGAITMFDGNTLAGGLTPDDRSFVGPGISVSQADLSIAPVRERITNAYYGIYASDVFDITRKLSLNLSGRFNAAQVDLTDEIGTSVSGNHEENRFNPGAGLTYKILPNLSVYGSYSEANRSPTPAEFACADVNSPCTLANFFTGDPDLKQIVARTFEVGVRGVATPFPGGRLKFEASLYHTDTSDDIIFSPSFIVGRDFFQNIGRSRRQGADVDMALSYGRLTGTLGYSYTDATFESAFTLDSSLNPGADARGQIHVVPGDQIPGIPRQQLKASLDYRVTRQWTVGGDAIASSGEVLVGDEANLTPRTGSYFVLNLHTSYQVTPHLQLFGLIDNVTDAKYATYGTFSQTNAVPIAQVPGASNPRALDPAAPIAGYAGVRLTF